MLAVKLSDELKKTAEEGFGWKKMEGFWLGVHHSHRYQSPQFIPELRHQNESMRRSTLVRRGGGSQWEMVEMAEPLMRLLDHEDEIEELQGREGKVLTFVAEDGVVLEQFGFELEEEHRLPRPGPEVFDDLAIPQANTDVDFEEFDGADIPVALEEDGGVSLEDQRLHHEVGVALPGSITVREPTTQSQGSLLVLQNWSKRWQGKMLRKTH